MADGQGRSVLRRKADAGRTSVAASRQVTPCKALSTALVQAADARLGLVAAVGACSARTGTLAELLDTLPEGGLLAVLEGPGEAQGLMVLDPALLAALIEKTMTGQLSRRPPQPRRPTRTDAALSADLVDEILRRFEAPFLGAPPARWAAGFGYASYLDDPRPLGLMMEDLDYRIVTVSGDLENGARACDLLLALPAAGRGPLSPVPRGAATASVRHGAAEDVSTEREAAGPAPEDDPPWSDALEAQVMDGQVTLTGVLYRMHLPIATLEALRPGQELPIPVRSIDETMILAPDGRVSARGRLGQSGGRRAVRLAGSGETAAGPRGGARQHPSPGAALPRALGATAGDTDDLWGALPEPGGVVSDPAPTGGGLPGLPDPPDLPELPALPDLAGGQPDDGDDDPLAGLPPIEGLPDLSLP